MVYLLGKALASDSQQRAHQLAMQQIAAGASGGGGGGGLGAPDQGMALAAVNGGNGNGHGGGGGGGGGGGDNPEGSTYISGCVTTHGVCAAFCVTCHLPLACLGVRYTRQEAPCDERASVC